MTQDTAPDTTYDDRFTGSEVEMLAPVEDTRTTVDLTGQPIGPPWDKVDFDADPEWEWRPAADDSPTTFTRCGAARWSARAPRGPPCSPTEVPISRRSSPPAPASRPTCGAFWSTCATSTPGTSATPTLSAKPSTSRPTRRPGKDLAAIFGTTDAGRCRCQWFKVVGWIWRDCAQDERTAMLRAQTACGNPNAATTKVVMAIAVPLVAAGSVG